MSISEAERHEIYELIKAATSDRVANNVMSLLPAVGWADVATKSDLEALRTQLTSEIGSVRAEIGSVRAEIGSVRAEMRSEIGSMRAELQSEIGSVRAEMRSEFGSVRADIRTLEANLLTEMHRSVRSQTWALVAWTTGLVGLMTALVR